MEEKKYYEQEEIEKEIQDIEEHIALLKEYKELMTKIGQLG